MRSSLALAAVIAILSASTAGAQTLEYRVPVNGLAVIVQPILQASSPTLDFGTIAVSGTKDLSVQIENKGGPANLAAEPLSAPYSVSSSTCPAKLNSNASCTVTVRFAPIGEGAFNSQSLQVTASGTTLSIPLTGSATQVPNITASVTALNFGTVNNLDSVDKDVTFTNSGGTTNASLSALSAPFALVSHNCTTLPKDGQCTAKVRFTPEAQTAYSTSLKLTTLAGETSVTLTGSGQTVDRTIPLTNGQQFRIPNGATNIVLSYAYSGSGSNSRTLYRNGVNVFSNSATSGGGSGGLSEGNGLLPGNQYLYSFSFSSSTQTLTSLTLRYRR